MELEAPEKGQRGRRGRKVTEELKMFMMQAMTRGFSLFEEALVVLETWDLNTEQYRKVAAAIQNAIQGCRDITGLFFKRVGRIESSQKLELVPSTSVNQFSQSVMSDSATPWTAAHQVSLSITNSWSLLKPMSIKLVMPSNHLILCRPLLLLPSISPNFRVFSNESALCNQVAKVLELQFQHQSFQRIFRVNFL